MHDFVSAFWGWFILVTVLGSIVGLTWFVWHYARYKPPKTADGGPGTSGHVWDEDLQEWNNPLPMWWLNLFYITLAFGVVYLVLFPGLGAFKGVLGWSATGEYAKEMAAAKAEYGPIFERYLAQDLQKVARDPDAVEIGERLYATYCTTCHGSDARGAPGYPNLRDDAWLYGGEPQAIKTSILKGRQGLMPAWSDILTEEQIEDVTEYVLHLAGRETALSAQVRGREVYQSSCAACHGAEGKGNTMMGAPNLTDAAWVYGSSARIITETIKNGRQGVMPAHETFLGEAKVHLLAAYVYSLSAPDEAPSAPADEGSEAAGAASVETADATAEP